MIQGGVKPRPRMYRLRFYARPHDQLIIACDVSVAFMLSFPLFMRVGLKLARIGKKKDNRCTNR